MNSNITNFIKTRIKGSKITILFAALILFAIIPTVVQAIAPAEQWNKTFGGTSDDGVKSVQNTSDGGYILAGTTSSYGAGGSDAWLIKVDNSGNQTWYKTFGGTLDDGARSVQQTSDGGYIIAGATASYGAGGTDEYGRAYSDVWLIKVDNSGNQTWNKTFGGSNYDHAFSVQQTSDGGYIIAADTNSSDPDTFYSPGWLIKVDSDGNQQWNTTFNKTDVGFDHHILSFDQTSDGGYIVAGCVEQSTSVEDFWLSKVDSDGNQIWSKTFTGSTGGYDFANSVQQTSDGGYILAGEMGGDLGDPGAAWLVKTDSNGKMTWDKRFGGGYETDVAGCAYSVDQTSDGGYIIAGTVRSYGVPFTDIWLIKVDSNGNQQWTKKFDGSMDDAAYSVQQASDGGYILAGETLSYGAGSADAWLIKVAPDVSTISSMAPTHDNRLRQSTPNTVLSSSNYIDIGRLGTTSYRGVMLFDLSGYDPADTISKASLSLYWYYPPGTTRTSDTTIEIYRPAAGWDSNYVTWNSRISGIRWNTPGGDWVDKNGVLQGSAPYASVTFPAGTVPDNRYYEFDVTQLVQEYVSGTANTGFFIKAQAEGNNYIAFYSSEWSNADQRPKLTITSVPMNNPPVAEAGPDQVVIVGETVTFNGSASTDDKGIVSYSWDFGDGTPYEATTPIATHTYANEGDYYRVTLTVTDTDGVSSSDTLHVVVNRPTTTATYTPDYDNRLRQSTPNTVLSSSNYVDIGRLGTTSYRGVMLFDLSGYNSNDTISKATLSLYWYYPPGAARTSDTVVEIYRPVEWSPQYVTWNSRMSGTPWDTAGGNWFDKNGVTQGTVPYASMTFPAGTVPDNRYYEFDVTRLVKEYVSGTANTGFFIKAKTEGNNYIAFYSSEWPNADQRPKLTITTTSVPVDNPPVAEAGPDKVAATDAVVTFNGNASTDDKGITTYSWDFNAEDGITTEATGVTATHTYTAAGNYTVTLTVNDTVGQADSDTLQVVVSSPTTTATYTPEYDNRLRQASPNTVYSSTNYLDIGRLGTTSYRDVILFDLSGYNSNDTISKATLSLYWYYPPGTTRTSDTVVEVYRPEQWNSQYVTWNSRMSGTPWTTAGGYWFDKNNVAQGTAPYASVTFPAGSVPDNKYYEFDVTQLVQEYVSGTYDNTGFFLKAKTEGNNYIAFYSSDWSNADQRPKLTVIKPE